jgi:hypothetical protein
MLTRSNLPDHNILPTLPPFSLQPKSTQLAQMVTLETFWENMKTAQAGFIGNSINGKVQILVQKKG